MGHSVRFQGVFKHCGLRSGNPREDAIRRDDVTHPALGCPASGTELKSRRPGELEYAAPAPFVMREVISATFVCNPVRAPKPKDRDLGCCAVGREDGLSGLYALADVDRHACGRNAQERHGASFLMEGRAPLVTHCSYEQFPPISACRGMGLNSPG